MYVEEVNVKAGIIDTEKLVPVSREELDEVEGGWVVTFVIIKILLTPVLLF